MSEAKFTKGPYFVQRVKAVSGMFTVTLGENGFNEDGDYLQVSLTESDSNAEQVASLFAAAPEMYEFIETYMGGHPEAEKLLSKARGEHV